MLLAVISRFGINIIYNSSFEMVLKEFELFIW